LIETAAIMRFLTGPVKAVAGPNPNQISFKIFLTDPSTRNWINGVMEYWEIPLKPARQHSNIPLLQKSQSKILSLRAVRIQCTGFC
jgi:hypothetical protein